MVHSRSGDTPTGDTELVIARTFDAPRALLYRAWTDPMRMVRWLGPRDYPAVSCELDLRAGGSWRACLRPPGGGPDLWQGGVYREVVENERLVFTFAWQPPHPAHGHPMLVTVTFADRDAGTEMVLRQTGLPSVAERDGHRRGWNSTFDRLAEMLAAAG